MRRSAGLKQSELGDLAGLTQAAISSIERGKWVPTTAKLDELLHHCGCQLSLGTVPLPPTHPESGPSVPLLFGPRSSVRAAQP